MPDDSLFHGQDNRVEFGVPKLTPKPEKTVKIDQNRLFLEKVQNHVLHAEMAYLTLSEDPDSLFMVKDSIFRGLGRYLAVLGCYLYMSVLMVYLCDVLFWPILTSF